MCCNITTLAANHINKWESAELMDGYVDGVTTIPYPGFGLIINIVSKQGIKIVSQLATSYIAHALISRKCPLML